MKSKSTEQRLITANRVLVFVCLALFSVTATAQVLHSHPEALAAKHCPICPVLHSVAPLTHSIQLDFSFHTTAYLSACSDTEHHTVEVTFALFSRPPPQA